MFGSSILEVLIGLVVVFLVLSIVVSALNEAWASATASRPRVLALGVAQLLGEDGKRAFYAHPRIRTLSPPDRFGFRKGQRRPSFVPAAVFAEVVLEQWSEPADVTQRELQLARDDLRLMRLTSQAEGWAKAAADNSESASCLQAELRSILARADGQVPSAARQRNTAVLAAVTKALGERFDQTMERATGWYRRRAQLASGIFAFVVVVMADADAIELAKVMYREPAVRAQMVALGQSIRDNPPSAVRAPSSGSAQGVTDATTAATEKAEAKEAPAGGAGSSAREAKDLLGKLAHEVELPLGWQDGDALAKDMKWLGLLLTVIAASLGAPFWFQVLGKLASLRSAGGAKDAGAKGDDDKAGKGEPAATAVPASASAAAPTGAEAVARPKLDEAYWQGVADRLALVGGPGAAAPTPEVAQLRLALDCARLSAIAYLDESVASRFAKSCGFDVKDWADEGSTQAMLCQRSNGDGDDDIVVCYRGTEPSRIEDWVADARFKLQQDPDNPGNRVHGGFARALSATFDQLEASRKKLPGGGRLVFTGHSLGAALATLHACRHAELPATHLVTFGSPRVGDIAFAAELNAKLGLRSQRFVNGRDIVTRVPPRLSGFDHIGKVRYFDDRGVLQADSADWFRWLADALDAAADLRSAGRTISDHAMELYIARIEAALAIAEGRG
ncbi:MAG: lipase family protein [Planctomycetes bacterium]|nr:lipase family protein [Planctomycetota bacterium]